MLTKIPRLPTGGFSLSAILLPSLLQPLNPLPQSVILGFEFFDGVHHAPDDGIVVDDEVAVFSYFHGFGQDVFGALGD
jgi:hypothetical protein